MTILVLFVPQEVRFLLLKEKFTRRLASLSADQVSHTFALVHSISFILFVFFYLFCFVTLQSYLQAMREFSNVMLEVH